MKQVLTLQELNEVARRCMEVLARWDGQDAHGHDLRVVADFAWALGLEVAVEVRPPGAQPEPPAS